MPASGPAALPAAYTANATETLQSANHPMLHENISLELRALWTELGLTPAAADSPGYVRLGDNAGKGLWVPLAALESPCLVLNGNFDHWQRVAGASQTSTTTYNTLTSYAADRMFVRPVGASVTQQRSTTIPDARSQFSLAVTGASSVTTVDIGQRIRSRIVNTRGLQSLVFSCYIRNESGAAFTPNLRIGTPASADNFATVTNRLDQALQSCPDSAWTRVYHVFDPSAYTNIANGMEVCLRVPSGSLVSGDTVRIAQFDLRPGTHLRGYVPPDPDAMRPLLEQYCWKNIPFATQPITDTTAVAYNVSWRSSGTIANNEYYVDIDLPVEMLATPTVTTWPYTTAANTGRSSNGSGTDYAANSAVFAGGSARKIPIQNQSGGTLSVISNGLVHVGILAIAEL